MDELQRLGARLEVIETALSVAMTEPEPEHRGRMLTALSAATEAVRAEHREAEIVQENRSSLRLLGGSFPTQTRRPDSAPTADAARGEHSTYRSPARARWSAG